MKHLLSPDFMLNRQKRDKRMNLFSLNIIKHLESELSSTPVTTLGVVLHCVICSQTDPLGKRTVLPHRLGELNFGAEGLLGRLLFISAKRTENEEY